MAFETKLIVAGDFVDAQMRGVYTRERALGEGVATVSASADTKDARQAANAAAAAFAGWANTPDATRAAVLERAADGLRDRADTIAEAMALETGATEDWARFNCDIAAGIFRHAAQMTRYPRRVERDGFDDSVRSYLLRQPVGVVLGIAPWNAPVVLATRAVAVPLAVGNTVVLKASEICPKTHSLVIETLMDAGAPPGAVNLVTNAPNQASEIVEALIGHNAVRRVNFTGSTRVGRVIAQTCAKHLKPVVLELSGKSAMVVLDDADVEHAARAAAHGAFFNQGQVCISTERIVVDASIADELVTRIADIARNLQVGDPQNKHVHMGPLISANAAIRVQDLVEDAVDKGARLVTGGGVFKSTMDPTVLDHVNTTMRIYGEESFGPVASVIRVNSEDEAITIANDSEFGLAGSVHSRDPERAMRVAEQLECGVCQINGSTVFDDAHMPFGGMKASGFGKMGGVESVDEFTELRWIAVHEEREALSLSSSRTNSDTRPPQSGV